MRPILCIAAGVGIFISYNYLAATQNAPGHDHRSPKIIEAKDDFSTQQEIHFQKNKEKYIQILKKNIDEQRKNIDYAKLKKDIQSAAIIEEASLVLAVGEEWLKIIESYRDYTTHLQRSFKIATNEIKSIPAVLKPVKYYESLNDRISKEKTEVQELYKQNVFTEENHACLQTILSSAERYLNFATTQTNSEIIHPLADRVHRLLETARLFIREHKKSRKTANTDNTSEISPQKGKEPLDKNTSKPKKVVSKDISPATAPAEKAKTSQSAALSDALALPARSTPASTNLTVTSLDSQHSPEPSPDNASTPESADANPTDQLPEQTPNP